MKKNKGQTLVEVIVAIGVIALVFMAAVNLSSAIIRNGVISRQKVQAVNLAQEGIEAVRNIRDTNWLDILAGVPIPWDFDINVNPNSQRIRYLGGKWRLNVNPPGETITLTNTQFTRRISITAPEGSSRPVRGISVEISWQAYGRPYTINIADYITNWR